MDKQIRTIIDLLKQNGGSMTFSALFEATVDKFDALAALLHTAKKNGAVKYEGVMLMQGKDDDVPIYLLKEDIEDSKVFHSVRLDAPIIQAPTGPEKCYICTKTVYPTERTAPNNRVRLNFF